MDNKIVRLVLGVLMTALLLAGVHWLSHFPVGSPPTDSMVRLAWRTVGAKVRICEKVSEESLQSIPKHMRRPLSCEERFIPYRLQLSVNGVQRLERMVMGAGAKGDRPLFVHEDILLPPGEHQLMVSYLPASDPVVLEQAFKDTFKGNEPLLEKTMKAANRYRLEQSVRLRQGRILLVELDETSKQFQLHGL